MENHRRNSIWINKGPDSVHGHRPPLNNECQNEQRHRTHGTMIGCHCSGLLPNAFAQASGFYRELPVYKDVERGINQQNDAERDGGKQEVGRVSGHSVKVTTTKREIYVKDLKILLNSKNVDISCDVMYC